MMGDWGGRNRDQSVDSNFGPVISKAMGLRFKIASAEVTFESFEGEILIINLANGSYHSLRGAAVAAWPMILAGRTVSEVAAQWPNETNAEAEIGAFVQKMVTAGLIVDRGDEAGASDEMVSVSEYASPIVESYTDMQDLLMLDPIHEVDMTGWPKQPSEGGSESK